MASNSEGRLAMEANLSIVIFLLNISNHHALLNRQGLYRTSLHKFHKCCFFQCLCYLCP